MAAPSSTPLKRPRDDDDDSIELVEEVALDERLRRDEETARARGDLVVIADEDDNDDAVAKWLLDAPAQAAAAAKLAPHVPVALLQKSVAELAAELRPNLGRPEAFAQRLRALRKKLDGASAADGARAANAVFYCYSGFKGQVDVRVFLNSMRFLAYAFAAFDLEIHDGYVLLLASFLQTQRRAIPVVRFEAGCGPACTPFPVRTPC